MLVINGIVHCQTGRKTRGRYLIHSWKKQICRFSDSIKEAYKWSVRWGCGVSRVFPDGEAYLVNLIKERGPEIFIKFLYDSPTFIEY